MQGYEPGNVIDPGTAAHREHGHAGAYLFDWLRWACAFIGLAVLSGKLLSGKLWACGERVPIMGKHVRKTLLWIATAGVALIILAVATLYLGIESARKPSPPASCRR